MLDGVLNEFDAERRLFVEARKHVGIDEVEGLGFAELARRLARARDGTHDLGDVKGLNAPVALDDVLAGEPFTNLHLHLHSSLWAKTPPNTTYSMSHPSEPRAVVALRDTRSNDYSKENKRAHHSFWGIPGYSRSRRFGRNACLLGLARANLRPLEPAVRHPR